MYRSIGLRVDLLNKLIWELREKGLWVERHSYSFRAMYGGRIVASFHVYPGFDLVVLRLYSGNEELDRYIESLIKEVISKYMPTYKVEVNRVERGTSYSGL